MIVPAYLNRVRKIFFEDESVVFTARQRRLGPGGSLLVPSVVVATNQRLLVIRDVLNLHIHEDIDAIPYANMTYVKIEHGLVSSDLIIGVFAYMKKEERDGSGTMDIVGLRYEDALELEQLIDKMIIKLRGKTPSEMLTMSQQSQEQARSKEKWKTICKKCNAPNAFDAHYCSNCGAML